jgi:2'-phosphotransferase
LKSLKVTFEEILHAVESSDKKRFALLYVPPAVTSSSSSSSHGDGFGAEAETVIKDADRSSIEKEIDKMTPLEEANMSMDSALSAGKNQQISAATAHALSVKDKDSSRFLIRATQGHSMMSIDSETLFERLTLGDAAAAAAAAADGDSGLKGEGEQIRTAKEKKMHKKSALPDTVVHGTYHGAWPLILASGGLRPMSRTKVHFATGPKLHEVLQHINPENNASSLPSLASNRVISGMRSDAEILIYIDLERALAAGCPFYRSENGVVLSEGIDIGGDGQTVIPLEFFDTVVERKERLGVLWDHGTVIQELPAHLMNKINPKGRRGGGNRGKG